MKKKIFTLKKQALLFVMLCSGMSLMADQILITVDSRDETNTGTTGFSNLEQAFIAAGYDDSDKLAGITDLKVATVGTYPYNSRDFDIALDQNDFTFLSTQLPKLASLDMSDALVTNNYGTGRGPSNSFPNNSFKNNKTIKTILLPAKLVGLGSGAFMNTALEGVIDIPVGVNGAANVDFNRFGNCTGITAFVADPLSVYITTVDGVVFNKDMTELHYYPAGKADENYTIPEGVVTLRNSAFECNHYLKNLTFASTVTTMQAGAGRYDVIANHSEIENIFVAEGNSVLGSVNGILYQKDGNKVVWSPKGKTVLRIAAPIQIIAGGGSQNSIFGGNGNSDFGNGSVSNNYTKVAKLIDLPATLEEVGDGAFVAADSLVAIICRAEEVPVNYSNTFRSVGAGLTPQYGTKVYVPANKLDEYKASKWVAGNGFNGFAANNFISFYNLDLTDATAESSIATDIALESDVVTITAAAAPADKVFDKWVSTTSGVTFDNAEDSTTTFSMPASNVVITATYKDGTPTGMQDTENTESQLKLYPNPATDYIQLSGADNLNYAIYNTVGQLVSTGVTNGEQISVSNLPNGVYIFKAERKAMQFIKK